MFFAPPLRAISIIFRICVRYKSSVRRRCWTFSPIDLYVCRRSKISLPLSEIVNDGESAFTRRPVLSKRTDALLVEDAAALKLRSWTRREMALSSARPAPAVQKWLSHGQLLCKTQSLTHIFGAVKEACPL